MLFFLQISLISFIFLSQSALTKDFELRLAGHKAIAFDQARFSGALSKQPEADIFSPVAFQTEDDKTLYGHFYDRGSDVVLILGHGFNASKAKWPENKVIDMFPACDIMTFDYRWNNMSDYLLSIKTLISPANRLVFDGKKDVRAAVGFLRKHKKYRKIIGLGECHSAYLFVATQVDVDKKGDMLFDKLILDSCWLKLSDFIDSLLIDPLLVLNTQTGYVPRFFKNILNWSPGINLSRFAWSWVMPSLSLKRYLRKLEVPVLFFYGKKDLLVSNASFDTIWKTTQSKEKAAVITPYEHVGNYANAALYSYFCNEFIENDFDQFVQLASTQLS